MNSIKKWLRKRETRREIRESVIEFNEASRYLYSNSKSDCEQYDEMKQALMEKILSLEQKLLNSRMN